MKKLTKFIAFVGVLSFSICMFTGCGKSDVTIIRRGDLKVTNADDEEIIENIKELRKERQEKIKEMKENGELPERPERPEGEKRERKNVDIKIVSYDNLATMLMALKKGDINSISVPSCAARYIVATNDDVEINERKRRNRIFNGYAFMFKEGNEELRDRFNEALQKMKNNGELEGLIKNNILGDGTGTVESVEMPSFPGAETITVAITGDLPPMDYINPDGEAAGFNTALMAKISEYLQINVAFISIDSASRAIALSTGKADVTFWAYANPEEEVITNIYELESYNEAASEMIAESDLPTGMILTETYFTDEKVEIRLKKDDNEN